MAGATHSSALNRLIEQLSRLPGIGRRSAERVAFFLLKQPADEAEQLAVAIREFKTNLKVCQICSNVTESDPCPICADPQRDQTLVMIVEQPSDIARIDATATYRGVYHVLMGRLAPLDGIGPGELNAEALMTRLSAGSVREVILATNPTMESDGTALYLAKHLRQAGVKVTKLARGLPTGSSLELVSKAVLVDAIDGRQAMDG